MGGLVDLGEVGIRFHEAPARDHQRGGGRGVIRGVDLGLGVKLVAVVFNLLPVLQRGRRILLSAQSLMIVRRMAYNSIMTATASFTLSPTPNDFHVQAHMAAQTD